MPKGGQGKRLLYGVLAAASAALLSSCISDESTYRVVTVDDKALATAETQCEIDGHPQWLKPGLRISGLLDLRTVADPATTGGRLVPAGHTDGYAASGDASLWFARPGVTTVDMVVDTLEPGVPDDPDRTFWPVTGAPLGVYRYTVLPADAPDCAQYKRYWKRMFRAANHLDPVFTPKTCTAYRYVGPFDLAAIPAGQFIAYHYTRSLGEGVGERVEEIRRGPEEVVARAVLYSVADRGLHDQPKCFQGNGHIESLFTAIGPSS